MVTARFRSRGRWPPKDAVTSASRRFPRRASCATRAFALASICLGGFFPEQAREILALDVTPFIFDVSIVAPLNAAANELGRQNVAVHLKIDTGATRLGVMPSELARAIEELRAATSLKLEGACTLFANAGDPTSVVTDSQLRVFNDALATLATAGMRPEVVHAANSAALVLRPDSHFNLVRPGLATYGLPPVLAVREKVDLTPVMTFKTRLMQMKRVPAGTGVGYGHTFVTQREIGDRHSAGGLCRWISARSSEWLRGADWRSSRAGGRRGLDGPDRDRSHRFARRRRWATK